ncbi:hypothetical protein MIND_00388600 [Mycena indigotica]|uniref:Uncharacterized protein n=1 Tax=Mycena indigotica TaxID=2126181 RepID=A0A8H6T572_9AGAR|nr:uncharacterized protein MIND_00388600 [Mycena indigotica]KAF7310152.1 hypothetical protein MIND_00388600 [Mycena indigotica]
MVLSRRIVVDDVSPRIQYDAGWAVADASALNAVGNYGAVYRGTTHSTTLDGAQLRFAFAGTFVDVVGSIGVVKLADGTYDPTWECTVDGIAIPQPNPTFPFPENHWSLCGQDNIPPGQHTLQIMVHTTQGRAFYLDNIVYRPVDEEGWNVDGAIVEYPNTDADVTFGAGWEQWGAQNITRTSGAQVALDFHGTEVMLIGFIPIELPPNSTTATYTIDDASPVTVNLPGIAPGLTVTQYNAVIFSAANLAPKPHHLVVTYHGDQSHTPLPVGSFHVVNAIGTSTVSSGPSGTPTQEIPSRHVATQNVALIVGIVIGCLVLAAAIIISTLYSIKHRRKRLRADAEAREPQPFADHRRGPQLSRSQRKQIAPMTAGTISEKLAGNSTTSPRRVVQHHEDSGLRYGPALEVVDIPPTYTQD